MSELKDEEIAVTAELKNARWVRVEGGHALRGLIYNDHAGRFDDGTEVTTTAVQKRVRPTIYQTKNSSYRVTFAEGESTNSMMMPVSPADPKFDPRGSCTGTFVTAKTDEQRALDIKNATAELNVLMGEAEENGLRIEIDTRSVGAMTGRRTMLDVIVSKRLAR